MPKLFFINDIKKSNTSCEYFDGEKKYIATADLQNGEIVNYELVDYNNKPSRANLISEIGSVIFAKMQDTIKVLEINESNVNNIYSTGFYSFKDNRILSRYMKFFFESKIFNTRKDKNCQGATMKAINDDGMSNISINVPSIDIQAKIVEELSNIEYLIKSNKNLIIHLETIVKSQFIEMIKDSSDSNVLNDFVAKCKINKCMDESFPPLSITKEDGFVLQKEKFKKRIASKDVSSYKVIPYGKLVMGLHIDEGAFAIQNIVPYGIVSPAYKAWNVRNDKVIPEVLQYCLRADDTIRYFKSKFKGTTVERRNLISENDLMNTPLNLPCLDKQKQFYQVMKKIDKSKYYGGVSYGIC